MPTPLSQKSSTAAIRARFDQDVARFSNLETGQQATIDAPLAMELITQAARAATPHLTHCLDVGCGAGNNTIRLLQACEQPFACDLNDLSQPMLEAAQKRVRAHTTADVRTFQGDFRTQVWEDASYDVILAAAVLHHLRDDADWEAAFAQLYRLLRPGGSLWITDLVAQDHPAVDALMWQRYADYLTALSGPSYQEAVFAYIDQEDSPRSLTYQVNLLQRVGFTTVEILHKNSCFAAFGAIKAHDA